MREQNYKDAVKANDPEALVAIIKMIYQRKQKRLAEGKSVRLRMQSISRWQKICYIWNWEWQLENQNRKSVKRLLIILIKADRKTDDSTRKKVFMKEKMQEKFCLTF